MRVPHLNQDTVGEGAEGKKTHECPFHWPTIRLPTFQARASEGCSFLTDCRDKWEDKHGPLQKHIAWHLGLFSLERGQESRATRVFDTLLAPPTVSEGESSGWG